MYINTDNTVEDMGWEVTDHKMYNKNAYAYMYYNGFSVEPRLYDIQDNNPYHVTIRCT